MIIEAIKNYFLKKEQGEPKGEAPEGMCPTCWGRDEWDGEYYKVIKDKHLLPDANVYESFISKIADKHVSTTHQHGHKYICTTCDQEIASNN